MICYHYIKYSLDGRKVLKKTPMNGRSIIAKYLDCTEFVEDAIAFFIEDGKRSVALKSLSSKIIKISLVPWKFAGYPVDIEGAYRPLRRALAFIIVKNQSKAKLSHKKRG